jgi:hypothetical protein
LPVCLLCSLCVVLVAACATSRSLVLRSPTGVCVCITLFTCVCVCDLLIPYLLTPWSRVHIEKLTDFQIVKRFPAFYGTRRFITAFTNDCHLSLSRATWIQTIPTHPTFWRSILKYSSRLNLGLPGFPTETL